MKNIQLMKDGVPTLQVNEPQELSDFDLIDVRTPDEFLGELGHITGTKLHTLGDELESYLKSADQNQKILFICRSGARSDNATLQAMSLGFKEVYNMEGGMILWNEKGFPTQTND